MRKTIVLTFTLLLTVTLALANATHPSQDNEMTKKKASKPAKAAAPASDTDIQKCIADKFAASQTIKNGAATVANGEATLTGEAKSPGAKGGATRSARACGAKKVINNMTVTEAPKGAAKGADKKS